MYILYKEKIKKIDNAIKESERFICAARSWKKRLQDKKTSFLLSTKEGGAAKRASLDLTRVLAKFRSVK